MILGIGTAHRACSLALVEGSEVIASTHEIIGRGHAERLMPMLADLLDGRRPDEIVVEVGPGSFTGIRIGVAAARALALAWKVPIHGISSMVLTAARAFAEGAEPPLAVVLDGGRGEVFTQSFESGPAERSEVSAVPADKFDFAGYRASQGPAFPLSRRPRASRRDRRALPISPTSRC